MHAYSDKLFADTDANINDGRQNDYIRLVGLRTYI